MPKMPEWATERDVEEMTYAEVKAEAVRLLREMKAVFERGPLDKESKLEAGPMKVDARRWTLHGGAGGTAYVPGEDDDSGLDSGESVVVVPLTRLEKEIARAAVAENRIGELERKRGRTAEQGKS